MGGASCAGGDAADQVPGWLQVLRDPGQLAPAALPRCYSDPAAWGDHVEAEDAPFLVTAPLRAPAPDRRARADGGKELLRPVRRLRGQHGRRQEQRLPRDTGLL